jgi:hypothetical protein
MRLTTDEKNFIVKKYAILGSPVKEPGEQNINQNMLQMDLLSRLSLKNSIKLVRFIV